LWIAGIAAVLVIGAGVNLTIGWEARARPGPPLWNIPVLNQMFTGVVGMLAGFSVTAAVFLASLGPGEGGAGFEAVVSTLIISFLILIAVAMMYTSTPGGPMATGEVDQMLAGLANVVTGGVYLLGLSASWFALPPLLTLIGLTRVAESIAWLLFAVAAFESARLGAIAYRLTVARGRACLAILLLGIGLATVYWLVATRVWPALWPPGDTLLGFEYVIFAVAFVGFVIQTGLLLVHDHMRPYQWVAQHGHRVALAYLQAVSIAVLLAWFAVTTAY
jgi:hypothetical protein